MAKEYDDKVMGKGELIDTLWNVNTGVQHTRWLPASELIDTLWNVNVTAAKSAGLIP